MNTIIHPAATAPLNSAFYIGTVFHKRLSPKVHQFDYPLYMTLLDLDEIDYLHRKHWWFSTRRFAPQQFKAADYCSSAENINVAPASNARELKANVLTIARSLGAQTDDISHVFMLAQLRCFGVYFSPVNFFFLHQGSHCKYLLAEVSNTPWNKKYCYLIDVDNPSLTPKTFHVSPFMGLNMNYKWTVKPPFDTTLIRIENWHKNKLFTAQFSAKRYDINTESIRKVLLRWPVIAGTIIKGIYWQAAKLFFKGIPFVPYQTTINAKPSATSKRSV